MTQTLSTLQVDIVGWADEAHPNRTASGTLLKLFEEVGEIVSAPDDIAEYADVIILLLDLAHQHGIRGDDLVEAVARKMEVNKARKWAVKSNGVMKHVD